jgi:LCP family protein required for cell wall assembly
MAPQPSTVRSQPPHQKWRWLWITLGLTGTALISAIAGAFLAASLASTPLLQNQLSPEDAEAFDQTDISTGSDFRLPRLTRPVNILVLGVKVLTSDVESPSDETGDLGYHALVNSFDGLSDTMLLIRFDPSNQSLTVLSLPRDTQTYVEGLGTTKLNAANAYGGPALTAKTTSELMGGISIDRYVRINVQGVEKLIDALGGVDVYVPYDMHYQDDSQHLYIDLKEGQQHLNGEQALQFLRFRYDQYGDIGRVQRQQTLMQAMVEQSLSPAMLARLPRILSIIQDHVDTNLSVEELVALVGFASRVDRSEVQMLMLPGEFGDPNSGNYSYWVPNFDGIDQMIEQYFDHGSGHIAAADPAYVRIAIQDSTGRDRSVQELVARLQDAGYSNTYPNATVWDQPLEETRIIAQQGDLETAKAIQEILGFGEVRVESTGDLDSDITIRLGSDGLTALRDRPAN